MATVTINRCSGGGHCTIIVKDALAQQTDRWDINYSQLTSGGGGGSDYRSMIMESIKSVVGSEATWANQQSLIQSQVYLEKDAVVLEMADGTPLVLANGQWMELIT